MTLAFASFKDFKLFQMDVKSAFLNGLVVKEVYIEQPPRFVDPTHLDFILKLDKALYGLKQVPRVWYERLSYFLAENSFIKGKFDTILFTKHVDNDILIVQIMLMILFLNLLMKSFVRILNHAWRKSLKWVWWERVWNEYDGRAQLLPWTPIQIKEWWNLQQPSQIHKKTYQEVWVWRCKD